MSPLSPAPFRTSEWLTGGSGADPAQSASSCPSAWASFRHLWRREADRLAAEEVEALHLLRDPGHGGGLPGGDPDGYLPSMKASTSGSALLPYAPGPRRLWWAMKLGGDPEPDEAEKSFFRNPFTRRRESICSYGSVFVPWEFCPENLFRCRRDTDYFQICFQEARKTLEACFECIVKEHGKI